MPHFTAKNPTDQNERQLRDLHSLLHSEPPGICCCTPTCSKSDVFGASISVRFLFTFFFKKKINFSARLGGYPFKASFPFFPPFFSSLSSFFSFSDCGSRLSPHRLHARNLLDLHNRDAEHLVNGLQLANLSGLLNWTKGNGLCATTVMSTTLTCTITGMSLTSPMCTVWHCANLSLYHTSSAHHSIHCRSAKTAGTCRAC